MKWAVLAFFGGFLAVILLHRSDSATAAPAKDLRLATFNIRDYGRGGTDEARLVELLGGLDADVIAVQEIQEPGRFDDLVRRLSRGERRYRLALSRCGGRSEMHVGFVYDAARVALDGTLEFPELDPDGRGGCSVGQRPGLLGRFRYADRPFELLVVHLAAGGDPDNAAKRRQQWSDALAIVDRRRRAGHAAIAVLGDTNSTGWLDDAHGERRFIEDRLAAAGLTLATAPLACSEYWTHGDGQYLPSLLDHVAMTPDFPAAPTPAVHGFCAALACRPVADSDPPTDYVTVSDHCPVTIGLRAPGSGLRPDPDPDPTRSP